MNTQPFSYYTRRIETLQATLNGLKRKSVFLSWARLFSFLAAALLAWMLWKEGWAWTLGGFGTGMVLFTWFVMQDLDNRYETENTKRLLEICNTETAALQHRFSAADDGNKWLPADHPYAVDLDLFGRASLYQYINRTQSEQGSRMLANWLLYPAAASAINARQDAVKELSGLPDWNQQLQATGMEYPLSLKTEQSVTRWLQTPAALQNAYTWKIVRWLFPAITTGTLLLWTANVIEQPLFLTLLSFYTAIAFWINNQVKPAWKSLEKITAELEIFSASIQHAENATFNAALLKQVQSAFLKENKPDASLQISRLKKIMDRLDYRLNPIVHIPLSVFLCWDLQQVFALEKWRGENNKGVTHWFTALAELEALSSLAVLRFNHPGWTLPVITEIPEFSCKNLGHPLIPAGQRVNNDFDAGGKGIINLVTGSNMAGKSTFLRSCGVNIILAMAGAPVCAAEMRIFPVQVMSSMRISDNLEESTSTFYAELKKLKAVIDAVNRKEPVFLLLDEILRGTNSADRHTGSKALIRQLIQQEASGIVATHDLELARLKEEFPAQLVNYHFDVSISNEELYFDYKLKTGICQSMNASLLMKKIGIKI